MTDQDTDIGQSLLRLKVPAHADGFWAELDAVIQQDQGTQVVGIGNRRNRPEVGRWIAIAAAGVAVVAIGLSSWLSRDGGADPGGTDGVVASSAAGDGAQTTAAPDSPTTIDQEASPRSTSATASTPAGADVTTTSIATATEAAPWSATVSMAEVPAVLVDEWNDAENRAWCPALYPDAAADAAGRVRAADFGGGWAVAWDLPDGPGSTAASEYCEDCGRSAFGVAGIGMPVADDTGTRMPNVIHFDDGAVAGYTGEGFEPANPKRLAEISIPDHGCVYQVWSHLGDDHLVSLLASLRAVDGLSQGRIDLRTVDDITYVNGGPAPWSGDAIAYEQPDMVLAPASLESLVPGAVARAVNGSTWGAAWDAPSGPGHDALNELCADCGRGVVGIVGMASGSFDGGDEQPWLQVIEWDDGSLAYFTWYLMDPAFPEEVAVRVTADTGTEMVDGVKAILSVPGVDDYIEVWSHLGPQHLYEVIEQLRFVER